ncbi:unnamed protein product [Thelazia callipaeda]|uniref:Ovule protein n=1 Tax=Thelazia callipaeda TaxID=103827 RepID=A0A0N5D959_THECL|nr:unnamed protein product [Thelazia callipaeda]
MWTKRDKRLEPLFIRPSSSHMEMGKYFRFQQPYQSQTSSTHTVSCSPGPASTVQWKTNGSRRKRFGLFTPMNAFIVMCILSKADI